MPITVPSHGRQVARLRRAVMCAVLTLTAAALGAPAAQAASANIADPADSAGLYFDITNVAVAHDSSAGSVTVTVSLANPVPADPSVYDPTGPSVYLAVWLKHDNATYCSAQTTGDTYINISAPFAPGGQLTATTNVAFHQDFPAAPVTVSPDRRSVTVTVTDPLLTSAVLRCVTASGSGRTVRDDTRSDGGLGYDSANGYFDGQAPAAPAIPPAPSPTTPKPAGAPGADAGACQTPKTTVSMEADAAPGRHATLRWDAPDDVDTTASDMTVTVTAPGAPARVITDPDATGTAPVPAGATATATWKETSLVFPYLGTATCTATRALHVAVAAARIPAPAVVNSGVRFTRGTPCRLLAARTITVTVRGPGGHTSGRLTDPCAPWSRVPLSVGKLQIFTQAPSAGAPARFAFGASHGNYSARYRVTVRVGSARPWRRTVIADAYHTPERRVYFETDAFVNYCINDNHQTYSYNGRLFCWRPASDDAWVTIQR